MLPSAVVAVMIAVPRPLAVTRPLLLTVDTLVSLEVHVTAELLALLGVTVAVSCKVSPLLMVAEVLLRLMPVAGWITVTSQVALKLLPSAVVAVMVAVPRDLAATKPLLLTVATLVLLDVHVTALLVVLLGDTVAVSCSVSPLLIVADVLSRLMPVARCATLNSNGKVPSTIKSMGSSAIAKLASLIAIE